jgi:hypothetical protein
VSPAAGMAGKQGIGAIIVDTSLSDTMERRLKGPTSTIAQITLLALPPY